MRKLSRVLSRKNVLGTSVVSELLPLRGEKEFEQQGLVVRRVPVDMCTKLCYPNHCIALSIL